MKLRTELPEAQELWVLSTSKILVVLKIEMQRATLINIVLFSNVTLHMETNLRTQFINQRNKETCYPIENCSCKPLRTPHKMIPAPAATKAKVL